jgi:hypothetical protein
LIGGTEADTDRQRHGIDDIVDGGPIKTDVDDEFVDLESRAQRLSQLQPVRLRDPPLGEAREVAAYTARVAVKRIKPNILSERFDESRAFYNDVIGLDGGEGLEWILFFGTDQPEVQLSVVKLDIKALMSTPTCRSTSTMSTPSTTAHVRLAPRSCIRSPTRSGVCAVSSCAIQTAQ